MRNRFFFLLALALISTPAFAQGAQADPATPPSTGYIRCPAGQLNVFLYETVTKFAVVSSPRCGDKVEVLGRVDTMGGYLQVRTADDKEGYVPQDQITDKAPASGKSRIAIVEPPPSIPAGNGSLLTGPLSQRTHSFGYDVPRIEAFGGYSYLSADWDALATRSGVHGWNTSVAINVSRWLGVEGGVSGNYQSNCLAAVGLTCSIYTFMGGPRVAAYRATNLTVYAHGLVGIGALEMSLSGAPLTNRDMAWAVGGEADYAVTSHFSVRGQMDYLRTNYLQSLGGLQQSNLRISAGVVYRIGKVITE